MNLANIVFPVYRLGTEQPITENGIEFYLYGRDINEADAEYKINIIDDKTRQEHSLALRRLAMKNEGVSLHKLSRAVFFIADLVKLAKGNIWFIDSEGIIFNYEKTTRVPLVFKEIEQIIPMKSGGALISVKGLSMRFKTLFMPEANMTHVGLLQIKHSFILYGLYDQMYDRTNRLI